MSPRDELLVVLDLSASVLRAGVGVHDLIRRPSLEISTTVALHGGEYLVGPQLLGHAEPLQLIRPLAGGGSHLAVNDYAALSALLRYTLHTALQLPRPPLAHPILLCLPAQLPKNDLDRLHALFFEELLVPQLLITSRPLLATVATGVLSALVLDIGQRGEGTEVGVVVESMVLEACTARVEVDEGTLDDWLSLQLLVADPSLASQLFPGLQGAAPDPTALRAVLSGLIASLKASDQIGFSSTLLDPLHRPVALVPETDESGAFDVAKVLVDGKLDKLVSEKKRKNKKKAGVGEDEDIVLLAHPFDTSLPSISIGPVRHRYLEPLFLPLLLTHLAPSSSATARLLGMQEYSLKEPSYAGIQEVVGIVMSEVLDLEARKSVWENIIVISTGRIANNSCAWSLSFSLARLTRLLSARTRIAVPAVSLSCRPELTSRKRTAQGAQAGAGPRLL